MHCNQGRVVTIIIASVLPSTTVYGQNESQQSSRNILHGQQSSHYDYFFDIIQYNRSRLYIKIFSDKNKFIATVKAV